MSDRRQCPDGGTCHHQCRGPSCFRVRFAGPLSDVYRDDEWPGWLVDTIRVGVTAHRVVQAIEDESPSPAVHQAVMENHRRQWPNLWARLDVLRDWMPR